jgi:uncharacterized protein
MTRRRQTVRIPLPGGQTLEGDLAVGTTPTDVAVVYVHGLGSTRAGDKARALETAVERRGWTFAAFDFRGHGGSAGVLLDMKGGTLLDDLQAVRSYLLGQGVRRLALVGSSMGGLGVGLVHQPSPGSGDRLRPDRARDGLRAASLGPTHRE